jgi:hypothetical protein
MGTAAILELANALLGALPTIITEVQTLAQKGEITADQQATVLAKYQALEALVNAGPFSGPEWKV